MAELLVSVRSAAEAEAALAGGAGIIDVKEPSATGAPPARSGSLARGSDETIAAVIRLVGARRPVSAAFSELLDGPRPFAEGGLSFAKWGLAGCAGRPDWPELMLKAAEEFAVLDSGRAVAVAYADARVVEAPTPAEVCRFACEHRWPAFLLDTARKDGRTLLDWLSVSEVRHLCGCCHRAGVRVALAGALDVTQIRTLLDVRPDWFAVRGAACLAGRGGTVDPEKVRRLQQLAAT